MKSRLLIILVLMALVAGSALGAFAYFNSAQTVQGTIESGTLTLALSDHDGDYGTITELPWDFIDMAPGDTVEGTLWMKNTGSIDAKQVTFEWGGILTDPDTADLATQIILTEVYDSKNTANAIAGVTSVADTNGDGKTSLYELAALSDTYHLPYDAVSDVSPFLPAGQASWLFMKFEFNPQAGNLYQGKTMTYNLTVTAEQVVVFGTP